MIINYKHKNMDDVRKRVRQAMEWLKDNRIFPSNRVIAEKMGYNPSVVSQVITGKANVSERFVKSLCGIYPALRYDWIWKGEGKMIAENPRQSQEAETVLPQMDRFSYILGSMADIIKSITELTCPLAGRVERLEKRVEEQAGEIERLRTELAESKKAATSRKK